MFSQNCTILNSELWRILYSQYFDNLKFIMLYIFKIINNYDFYVWKKYHLNNDLKTGGSASKIKTNSSANKWLEIYMPEYFGLVCYFGGPQPPVLKDFFWFCTQEILLDDCMGYRDRTQFYHMQSMYLPTVLWLCPQSMFKQKRMFYDVFFLVDLAIMQ